MGTPEQGALGLASLLALALLVDLTASCLLTRMLRRRQPCVVAFFVMEWDGEESPDLGSLVRKLRLQEEAGPRSCHF